MKRSMALFVAAALLGAAAGCGNTPPRIVEAEGVLTLDGRPLPFATVEFIPELKGFGAEYNSAAEADENGRLALVRAYKRQPGAAVATHRVVVTDTTPRDVRGTDADSQARAAKYQASLVNRPIPPEYGNFTRTPLRVTVEKGKKTYDVALVRQNK